MLRRGEVDTRARQRIGISLAQLQTDELARLEEQIDLTDSARRVDSAIDGLPKGIAAAVRLHCVQELPYEQVATQLGISQANARKRVSRGLTQLAGRIGANPFESNG